MDGRITDADIARSRDWLPGDIIRFEDFMTGSEWGTFVVTAVGVRTVVWRQLWNRGGEWCCLCSERCTTLLCRKVSMRLIGRCGAYLLDTPKPLRASLWDECLEGSDV